MANRSDKSFVITTPFGCNTFDLDDIQAGNGVGEAAADVASTSQELVWPLVPLDFEPPSPAQESAVREVAYISLLLTSHSPPRPDDDLELLSLLLLSLETRNDISRRLLQYTEAERALNDVHSKCDTEEANNLDLAARAKALEQHWKDCSRSRDPSKTDSTGDIAYPALRDAGDAGKPAGWKLGLSAAASSEADSIFRAVKMEREHACSYFRRHTPTPIAWHPKTSDAWSKVDRRMAKTGRLHHSPDFVPIYMSFPMQLMDVDFMWKNPDWDEEHVKQYRRAMSSKWGFEDTKRSCPLRSEDILTSSPI